MYTLIEGVVFVVSLVASGYSNDPVMASFSDYGFCGAVVKPFMLKELATVLQEALN